MPLTRQGLEQLLVKIEWGSAQLERSKDNVVRRPKAELELAEYFDEARSFLETVLQKSDKRLLRDIFGGDCKLLARLEALCQRVEELKVTSDKRRQVVLSLCTSVEQVIADLGYAVQLRQAQVAEQAILEEADAEEDFVDEVVPHLAEAAFLGAEAVARERVGDVVGAVQKYTQACCSMRTAIAVCRAVIRFKASVGGTAEVAKDVGKLEILEHQTQERIQHLSTLEPGTVPAVPVEEHIRPLDLEMHENPKTRRKMLAAYAGYGLLTGVAVTGLCMSGPFGFALVAGLALGGTLTYSLTEPKDSELRLLVGDMGEVAVEHARDLSKTLGQSFRALSPRRLRALPPCSPGDAPHCNSLRPLRALRV